MQMFAIFSEFVNRVRLLEDSESSGGDDTAFNKLCERQALSPSIPVLGQPGRYCHQLWRTKNSMTPASTSVFCKTANSWDCWPEWNLKGCKFERQMSSWNVVLLIPC